jgi:hypothetical protein
VFRVSLFIYANYEAPPYYTYWRITQFFTEAPDSDDIDDMERELLDYAENESRRKGWSMAKTVKREIEQVDEAERYGMPVGESRISASHGRFENIPSEDYIRFRQKRPTRDDDNDMEDSE